MNDFGPVYRRKNCEKDHVVMVWGVRWIFVVYVLSEPTETAVVMRPVVPASGEILVFQNTSERPELRGL
jgi:hypothetical protein